MKVPSSDKSIEEYPGKIVEMDMVSVRPLLIIGDEGDYLRVICPVPSLTAVHVSSVHVYLCVLSL